MKTTSRLRSFLTIAGSSLLAVSSASAVNWTNTTTGTQQWNTVGNWDAAVPNGIGAVANLSVNLAAVQTVNLATAVTLGSLTYGDTTTGFFAQNISGSAITFNNSGSGATLTKAGADTLATTISNNLVLNDNLTIVNNGTTANANNAITLSGVISGTGGLILNAGGGGSIYLSNAGNTYSGGVTFNSSTTSVVVGQIGQAFGTGTITFNAAATVSTGTPGGAAYLLTTANTNVWNSGFTVGGQWNSNGNVTLGANVSVARGTNFGLGGNIGETVSARSLTLTGGGNTVLSGTNTYTGGTTVSGGSLAFLKTASMPSTGNVSFATGTTLGIGLGGAGWTSTGTGAGTLAGIFQGTNVGVGAGSSSLSYTTAVGLELIVTGSHSFGVIENLGSGATAFTKSGTGTLTIAGDNTYTGATIVTGGGGLILDYGSSDTSKFASAAALTLGGANRDTGSLGGGTITLKGGTFTEVVSATSLNAGHMTIARDGGTAKLRLNAITRAAGSSISFADATIAQTDTNNFGASGVNGILGGWATVGNDWAVSANTGSADTAITALASYTAFVNTGGSATTNYSLGGTDALTGATAVGTLKITDSGAGQSLTLGAHNLTITSTSATALGGIMYAGGVDGNYTIAGGGAGRIATSTGNQELIFAVQSGTLTVNAIIANNSSITKSGAGTLVLGGTNTTSGAIIVNQGVLRLNNAAASGAGSQYSLLNNFVHSGAALELTGGFSFTADEQFYISGTGISDGGALRSVSGANTWNAKIETGRDGARINNDSAGLLTLAQGIISAPGGDVTIGGTGNTTISTPTGQWSRQSITGGGGLIKDGAGTLTLNGPSNYAGGTTVSAGTLVLGHATSALPDTGAVTVNGATAILSIGANSDTVGAVSLKGGGQINGSGGTLTGSSYAVESGSVSAKLGGSGVALTKSTGGTVTLSGANTYTGATTVSAGVLAVNGSLANTSTTVGNGGTLQGSGSIAGSVTVQSGGTLATGNSIESMATGAMSLEAGSTFAYEMNKDAAPGLAGDLTAVTGTLDIAGDAILTLAELGAGSWTVGDKLTLISYTGLWNGGLFDYPGIAALADDSTFSFSGTNWTFNYNDTLEGTNYASESPDGESYVTMTAVVPEPNVAGLLGGLGMLMLLRRRRKCD